MPRLSRIPLGFTLIELLVTITIVAVLSSVGFVTYARVQKNARISKRVQDLNAIHTAIELFKTSKGFYPINAGLFSCVNSLTGASELSPDFMPAVPLDPIKDKCYKYQSDEEGIEYKIKLDDLPKVEMDASDFIQQVGLIDPQRDGGSSSSCKVESGPGLTPSSWAYYTPGACEY